jgi:hypothetical protein
MKIRPAVRRPPKPSVLLAALVLACCAAPCAARDWYVSVSGPAGSAGTLSDPTELFSALGRAAAGDSVILRGGLYSLSKQVFLEQPNLTLRNYPGERPVLSMPVDNPSLLSVVWPYANGCSVIGLEIVGGAWYCVKMDYPDCILKDCVIHGSGHDAVKIARPADRCIVDNCEIYDTGKTYPSNAEGIDNVGCDEVVVRDCYIHDIATNGLYMKGGASRCIIERNYVVNCAGHGIMLGQSTDLDLIKDPPYECRDSVARNNAVRATQYSGLAFEAAYNCRFYNNTLYDVAVLGSGGITVRVNEHGTPSKNVFVRNNIVVVLSDRPMFFVQPLGLQALADMSCDNNLYYNPRSHYTFWWEPGGLYLSSLQQWQSNTPYDAHSFCADPMLDLFGRLRPMAGSPVRGRGAPPEHSAGPALRAEKGDRHR